MFDSDELTSLRWDPARGALEIIDQNLLPHVVRRCHLDSVSAYCQAIRSMQVRGAPLIGLTAAYGLAQALDGDPSDESLASATAALCATRPTAVNLRAALRDIADCVASLPPARRPAAARARAESLRAEMIADCARIGEHGLALLRQLPRTGALNVMTHCNAGWLATVQWGTALAPVYKAREAGLPVHVWVSETRPRNQGMSLTAWELQRAGVPHTVVADNACGYLMQQGRVDCVIVGSDRTAANGDVCNKVGTYLKALAARAAGIPFYVALPESTIDMACPDGALIPIEERAGAEVLSMRGRSASGEACEIALAPPGSVAHNPAFDITPASLVTALITERGCVEASQEGLRRLFSGSGARDAGGAG